ncbi:MULTISPECIES: hypothetical protein [Deefgea]|uniref:Uncharacterized protein n=1 Tax=Deefgea chitinilytica TaxID=570276 RepID=A0ABS2CA15_9NEIS|nr:MULTISPECIES: hypothetical protein [Deefgea]MBM5570897.1 hypothetical protein [Deefgea chitinilytica]MBM9888126.1 hypothetical protein [Deefgea sp. CFH1-16]
MTHKLNGSRNQACSPLTIRTTVEKNPCTSIFYAVNIKEKKYSPDKSINPLKIDDYVYLRYHIGSTIQHSIGNESAITKK